MVWAWHTQAGRWVGGEARSLARSEGCTGHALALLLLPPMPPAHAPHDPLLGAQWPHAALLVAMVASTDALAVSAIIKTAGGPEALVVLMEGESLLNDASGERGGGAGGRRGAAPALQWHASEQLALR